LVKGGDSLAAQKVWENYFQRLVRIARKKLRDSPRRSADEEDVALSAFASFCRSVQQGRFPQLSDCHDLWQVLVMLTARKAIDQIKRERRQKRGAGKVKDEAWLLGQNPEADGPALDQVIGREPSPAFACQVAEECKRLLDSLPDEQLGTIALWKLEGFTNDEIGARLDCSLHTVERRLHRIRLVWEKETDR
jgi:RNA polymerase sigma factor (sigma-70 family)